MEKSLTSSSSLLLGADIARGLHQFGIRCMKLIRMNLMSHVSIAPKMTPRNSALNSKLEASQPWSCSTRPRNMPTNKRETLPPSPPSPKEDSKNQSQKTSPISKSDLKGSPNCRKRCQDSQTNLWSLLTKHSTQQVSPSFLRLLELFYALLFCCLQWLPSFVFSVWKMMRMLLIRLSTRRSPLLRSQKLSHPQARKKGERRLNEWIQVMMIRGL